MSLLLIMSHYLCMCPSLRHCWGQQWLLIPVSRGEAQCLGQSGCWMSICMNVYCALWLNLLRICVPICIISREPCFVSFMKSFFPASILLWTIQTIYSVLLSFKSDQAYREGLHASKARQRINLLVHKLHSTDVVFIDITPTLRLSVLDQIEGEGRIKFSAKSQLLGNKWSLKANYCIVSILYSSVQNCSVQRLLCTIPVKFLK